MQDRLVWTVSLVAVVSIEVAEKGSSVIVKTQSEAESSGIQKTVAGTSRKELL